jgi:Fe-S oxidoreductase
MLTLARRYLRGLLAALESPIEAGVPLVALEPSCLSVFRDELTNLFPGDAQAQRLRAQSFTLAEFLDRHAADWPVPTLDRDALVQAHCHHHAVLGFGTDEKLLRRMGLRVRRPDAGCCGMAGSFGYEAGEKYRVSVAAGERVLLPAVRAAGADTLIVADGFSCRGQIRAGTDREGLHLAEVLALALREGPGQPGADGYPERRLPEVTPAARGRTERVLAGAGLATAGGLAAAGAVAGAVAVLGRGGARR